MKTKKARIQVNPDLLMVLYDSHHLKETIWLLPDVIYRIPAGEYVVEMYGNGENVLLQPTSPSKPHDFEWLSKTGDITWLSAEDLRALESKKCVQVTDGDLLDPF